MHHAGAMAQVCGLLLAAKAQPSAIQLRALQAAWQPFRGRLPPQLYNDYGARRRAECSVQTAIGALQQRQEPAQPA